MYVCMYRISSYPYSFRRKFGKCSQVLPLDKLEASKFFGIGLNMKTKLCSSFVGFPIIGRKYLMKFFDGS